jgi:hypothetical protein
VWFLQITGEVARHKLSVGAYMELFRILKAQHPDIASIDIIAQAWAFDDEYVANFAPPEVPEVHNDILQDLTQHLAAKCADRVRMRFELCHIVH